jgi:hypothetical protein
MAHIQSSTEGKEKEGKLDIALIFHYSYNLKM